MKPFWNNKEYTKWKTAGKSLKGSKRPDSSPYMMQLQKSASKRDTDEPGTSTEPPSKRV